MKENASRPDILNKVALPRIESVLETLNVDADPNKILDLLNKIKDATVNWHEIKKKNLDNRQKAELGYPIMDLGFVMGREDTYANEVGTALLYDSNPYFAFGGKENNSAELGIAMVMSKPYNFFRSNRYHVQLKTAPVILIVPDVLNREKFHFKKLPHSMLNTVESFSFPINALSHFCIPIPK